MYSFDNLIKNTIYASILTVTFLINYFQEDSEMEYSFME